jgi:hypothetical protein
MGHCHFNDECREREAWDAGMIDTLATSEIGGFWNWVAITQTTEGVGCRTAAIGALSTKS